jgi:hypothetical protein
VARELIKDGSCRFTIRTRPRFDREAWKGRRIWVRLAVGRVTENTKPEAWGLICRHRPNWATRPRTRCCRRRSQLRAEAARDQRAGGRHRRRFQRRSDERRARGFQPENVFIAGRQELGSKPHQRAVTLPSRRGGPCQPPQTPLWAGPIPAEGRPGPANLDNWAILAHNTGTLAVRSRSNAPNRSFDKSKSIHLPTAARLHCTAVSSSSTLPREVPTCNQSEQTGDSARRSAYPDHGLGMRFGDHPRCYR